MISSPIKQSGLELSLQLFSYSFNYSKPTNFFVHETIFYNWRAFIGMEIKKAVLTKKLTSFYLFSPLFPISMPFSKKYAQNGLNKELGVF